MGAVSRAVVAGGGHVTGVIPHAMLAAGGEQDKGKPDPKRAVDEKSALVVLPPNNEKVRCRL